MHIYYDKYMTKRGCRTTCVYVCNIYTYTNKYGYIRTREDMNTNAGWGEIVLPITRQTYTTSTALPSLLYYSRVVCVCVCTQPLYIIRLYGDRVTLIRRQPGGPTASTSARALRVLLLQLLLLLLPLPRYIIYTYTLLTYKYMCVRACVWRIYVYFGICAATRVPYLDRRLTCTGAPRLPMGIETERTWPP